ncbi:hypothetical protein H2203_006950 [Taxawa tesnikishii (nom. ined.)]|nr:hypothetical protein H2203_006950 [Dothideales sp. JES 119]
MAQDSGQTNGLDKHDGDIESGSVTPVRDDVSEFDPNDSTSQIGYAPATNEDVEQQRNYSRPFSPTNRPPAVSKQANGTHGRSMSTMKNGVPSTPPSSSRASIRSSRIPTPTTFVPSRKDRVRYSWQSIRDDEPNRPRIHIIKIVSNTATASAGFPQGEAFGFSISHGGRRIAAYNSARLFILQTAALPVNVSQEYALRRRPLAVEMVDDGNILAVLADQHTVNIYDLSHHSVPRIKTIKPDFPTSTIALAPTGGLLAAAYEGGVEIFSLAPDALSTDRRAIRCPRMDKLVFSDDGSTLLGTTTRINASSTVVVTEGGLVHRTLNPENIRNSSHATFMRESGATCNEKLFAWNGLEDTFGILNTADMEYSSVDFPVTISPPLSTVGGLGAAIHSCPSLDEQGDTVAMIVNDRTIRLYIVPHKAEEDQTKVEAHSIDHELDDEYGCPFTEVRWVRSAANLPAPTGIQSQIRGRLVAASPGGLVDSAMAEDSVEDIEGGRIILFDFDPQFAGQPGQTFTLNLGKAPPQMLKEEELDVTQEVALIRRRTVNQSKSGTLNQKTPTLGRAATTVTSSRNLQPLPRSISPTNSIQQSPINVHPPVALNNRRSHMSMLSMSSEGGTRSLPDLLETSEAVEEPYVIGAPRSAATLQRAATAANRHRYQALEERAAERNSTDSVLPLPEYTEEPNAPLPSRFRALAGLDIPQYPGHASITNGANASPISAIATAPPTFPGADRAFAAALASQGLGVSPSTGTLNSAVSPGSSSSTPSSTPANPNTFRAPTLAMPMPRALQRAYSNAMNPFGTGPAPSIIGDWENVSPIMSRTPTTRTIQPHPHTQVQQQPVWPIHPQPGAPPSASPLSPSSPFTRMQTNSRNSLRFSQSGVSVVSNSSNTTNNTAILNPTNPATMQPTPPTVHTNPPIPADGTFPSFSPDATAGDERPTSAASTTAGNVRTASAGARGPHRPAHVAAFHALNTANLMPSNPHHAYRHSMQTAPVGSVPHPVMAWHPPAPSAQPGEARGGEGEVWMGWVG